MSAQESTIAILQQQLHLENQRRFEQVENTLAEQGKTLNKIMLNTTDLPRLKDRVESLEVDSNRMKGAGGLVALLPPAVRAIVLAAVAWYVWYRNGQKPDSTPSTKQ